jgi:hypothetical protein
MTHVHCLCHPGLAIIHGHETYRVRPGVTEIPDEVWRSWLETHADSDLVTSGQVFETTPIAPSPSPPPEPTSVSYRDLATPRPA